MKRNRISKYKKKRKRKRKEDGLILFLVNESAREMNKYKKF